MSVLAQSVGILWRVIESYGLEPAPFFEAAGVSLSWPVEPGTRMPYEDLDQVRASAAEASGDPAFGLRTASCLHPSYLGALGYAVLASDTLRIAFAGIIASTLLGMVIGIARLSHNWLASKMASVYVETLRNIPVLVQILAASIVVVYLYPITRERHAQVRAELEAHRAEAETHVNLTRQSDHLLATAVWNGAHSVFGSTVTTSE